MFYSDNLPSIDDLHRLPFARAIAKGLLSTTDRSSITVGIESEWGSGKSTLLHYIRSELKLPDIGLQPIVIDFSPWVISGFSSLLEYFFLTLAATLKSNFLPDGTRAISASRKVIKYLALVEHAKYLKYVPGAGTFGNLAEDVAAWAREASKAGDEATERIVNLLPTATIDSQRSAVERALAELKKPVIVLIDDIDRLQPEEIRQVFQLVKAVGAIEGMRYVLTYDPKIVGKALSSNLDEAEGRRYLEKIVQIQYRLPHVFAWQLHELVKRHIDDLLDSTSTALARDDARFVEAVALSATLCRTPRDVIRLKNKLSITLPATSRSVSASDVIVFETLDLVFPEVTAAIRRFPREFLGSEFASPIDTLSFDVEPESPFIKEGQSATWAAHLPKDAEDARCVRRALLFIFPQLQASATRGDVSSDSIANIDVLQRLLLITGHPDLLDGDAASKALASPEAVLATLLAKRSEVASVAQQLAIHSRKAQRLDSGAIIRAIGRAYEELNAAERLRVEETAALAGLVSEIIRASSVREVLLTIVASEAPLSLAHDVVLEAATEHGLWLHKPNSATSAGTRLVESESAVRQAIQIWRHRVEIADPKVIAKEARAMGILFRYDQLGSGPSSSRDLFRKLWDVDRRSALNLVVNRDGQLSQWSYLDVLPPVDEVIEQLTRDPDLNRDFASFVAQLKNPEVQARCTNATPKS